jgi:hypothetical protein
MRTQHNQLKNRFLGVRQAQTAPPLTGKSSKACLVQISERFCSMLRLLLINMVLAASAAPCANADDLYKVSNADTAFLSRVVTAVSSKDTDWIANHMSYPLTVTTKGGKKLIKEKNAFSAILRDRLTDKLVAEIVADSKKPLFKNWQGVMAGDGILWFNDYQDGTPPSSQYVILAIGNFAYQPRLWVHPDHGTQP